MVRLAERAALHTQLFTEDCLHGIRGWRYPHVPFWTVAPDLSNRWGRLRHLRLSARGGLAQCCQQAMAPGVYKLGSGGNPIRIEHRRRRQNQLLPINLGAFRYNSSCRPFSKADSTRSRRIRKRPPTSESRLVSRLRNRISSFAILSAAITAMRSKPTTFPLSRISRILRFKNSAESSKSERSSMGQEMWYSFSSIRTLTRA